MIEKLVVIVFFVSTCSNIRHCLKLRPSLYIIWIFLMFKNGMSKIHVWTEFNALSLNLQLEIIKK